MISIQPSEKRVEGQGPRFVVNRDVLIQVQMLRVEGSGPERFPGELISKTHRPLYHSTLGSRVIKKRKRRMQCGNFINF